MKAHHNLFLPFIFSFAFLLFSCGNDTTSLEEIIEYRQDSTIQIIPWPTTGLEIESGYFTINEKSIIWADSSLVNEAYYLKSLIERASKFSVDVKFSPPDSLSKNGIHLFRSFGWENSELSGQEKEMYILLNEKGNYTILSPTNEGIMRGIQSLRQLFVNEFHTKEKRDAWYLPIVKIADSPKFVHRGLLLDCSRHFFKKEVVKKYIDLLALYKMNVFHWHLTEDQGWRIAIGKYPKLTEIGAWRTELNGDKYGGFHTKEDIREIVAYAQERHITVIPEIELPGHSQAAIAAYPHLSCTGEQVDVANDWGVFKEIYCAGNDSVFIFLEDVLTEVMELFPSKYIHIGGDEAPKYRWEHCEKCQHRIKTEGLKDEHGLQSYFISRIEQFLNKNGRQLIGWDEILEGGLSENATVQSWRGMEGGTEAAYHGHQAIMSPTSHCYFDYDLKAIDLEKVYNFDPIPPSLPQDKQHFIIGGEANMWTEHVPDENNLDSKVFPRLLAMSEVLWSYPKKRNYDEFYERVQHHYPILKNLNVSYGNEHVPASIEVSQIKDQIMIRPIRRNKNLTLQHAWSYDSIQENSYIGSKSSQLKLEKSGTLSVQAFKNDEKYGEPITQAFEFHAALTKIVEYKTKYNEWYTAGGDYGLVDGKVGSLDFRDGNWQGFWGEDFECVVDLGKEKPINSISTNFFQYNNSWIFLPQKVHYEVSMDGKNFVSVAELQPKGKPEQRGKFLENFSANFNTQKARYIRVKAQNIMTVPNWHEAAGSEAWIFIDEIVVK